MSNDEYAIPILFCPWCGESLVPAEPKPVVRRHRQFTACNSMAFTIGAYKGK